MIEKMKFVSITGPKNDIDRVVEQYLSKYEIHLENAVTELKSVSNLTPYVQANPYKDALAKANEYLERLDVQPENLSIEEMSSEEALTLIDNLEKKLSILNTQYEDAKEHKNLAVQSLKKIQPFRELQYNIDTILHFEFIRFRFGKIAKEYYEKFRKYVYEDIDTYFYQCHVDEDYVWGVYFVPACESHKIDAIYSSLHFERFFLPDEYTGTPEEAYKSLEDEIATYSNQMKDLEERIQKELEDSKEALLKAQSRVEELTMNFDIRKMAACTRKDDREFFYILCGWMPVLHAKSLEKDIENDSNVFFISENDSENAENLPPTKLNNPKIFKPFEMFIHMYGLPAYNEIDPTIFVALTYAFIFGAMFGDAGQGLCLMIGGFLLYKIKKIDLAGIIGSAGIFSTIFGFLYGSFFGFENLIKPLWIRPIEHMTQLPFVGKLNTVFVVAIAFGMGLILVTMILNIIDGIKSHRVKEIILDTNGIAGLVFYGSAVATIVLFMSGHALPGAIVLIIMFVIPLLLIVLKEPIMNMIEKKKKEKSTGPVMFAVQSFFEAFEILLSYFSNTISFVRVGAFAVSHAAMMQVVLMLAGAESGGSPNWIVIILGNLAVAGMEGLVVGIQVLRLEYYEIFSRFYKGNGRPFQPFQHHKQVSKKQIQS